MTQWMNEWMTKPKCSSNEGEKWQSIVSISWPINNVHNCRWNIRHCEGDFMCRSFINIQFTGHCCSATLFRTYSATQYRCCRIVRRELVLSTTTAPPRPFQFPSVDHRFMAFNGYCLIIEWYCSTDWPFATRFRQNIPGWLDPLLEWTLCASLTRPATKSFTELWSLVRSISCDI